MDSTERVFRFNIECDVGEDFLHDIMTTAVEGGIGYWCRCAIERADEDLSVTRIYDAEDAETGEPFLDKRGELVDIDKFEIFHAAQAIAAGRVKVGEWIRNAVYDDIVRGECGLSIDAEVADVIVQVAFFGEVVYG